MILIFSHSYLLFHHSIIIRKTSTIQYHKETTTQEHNRFTMGKPTMGEKPSQPFLQRITVTRDTPNSTNKQDDRPSRTKSTLHNFVHKDLYNKVSKRSVTFSRNSHCATKIYHGEQGSKRTKMCPLFQPLNYSIELHIIPYNMSLRLRLVPQINVLHISTYFHRDNVPQTRTLKQR